MTHALSEVVAGIVATLAAFSWLGRNVVKDDADTTECHAYVLDSLSDADPEEDARLIAAAPDLLAACEMLIKSWASGHQREKLDVALRMAERAIEKAKGEAE